MKIIEIITDHHTQNIKIWMPSTNWTLCEREETPRRFTCPSAQKDLWLFSTGGHSDAEILRWMVTLNDDAIRIFSFSWLICCWLAAWWIIRFCGFMQISCVSVCVENRNHTQNDHFGGHPVSVARLNYPDSVLMIIPDAIVLLIIYLFFQIADKDFFHCSHFCVWMLIKMMGWARVPIHGCCLMALQWMAFKFVNHQCTIVTFSHRPDSSDGKGVNYGIGETLRTYDSGGHVNLRSISMILVANAGN